MKSRSHGGSRKTKKTRKNRGRKHKATKHGKHRTFGGSYGTTSGGVMQCPSLYCPYEQGY
jgi:hypothetical protein